MDGFLLSFFNYVCGWESRHVINGHPLKKEANSGFFLVQSQNLEGWEQADGHILAECRIYKWLH